MPASLGTPTIYTLQTTTDVSSWSWNHTRGSDAALVVLFIYMSNGNPSPTVSSVTFGSASMTIRAQDVVNGVTRVGAAVATLEPGEGPVGTQTVTATVSAAAARDIVAFTCDVISTSGAGSGTADAVYDSGATSISLDYTPGSADSLIVAIGGCRDGSGTVSQATGWDQAANAQSGSGANDVEAVLMHRVASTAVTASATFSASRTDRAIAVVGFAPTLSSTSLLLAC